MELPRRAGSIRQSEETRPPKKKKKVNLKKKTRLFACATLLQSHNYSTENKADLNCWVRISYNFELAATFYTHYQEVQIAMQGGALDFGRVSPDLR